MSVEPGDYEVGPPNSRLLLRTSRQGIASKAGHDLVLEATDWRGRIRVPTDPSASPSVEVEVDMRRLQVVEGSGGVKPLTDADKREIHKAMQKPLRTGEHPMATFAASDVRPDGDGATIEGDLSLAGQIHPFQMRVRDLGNGTVSGAAEVLQSDWGIKPYTGFFGALKLRDAVEVEVLIALTSP